MTFVSLFRKSQGSGFGPEECGASFFAAAFPAGVIDEAIMFVLMSRHERVDSGCDYWFKLLFP